MLTAFRTEQVTRQYRATGPGVRFVPHISPELNVSGRDGERGQDRHCTDVGFLMEPIQEDWDVTTTTCPLLLRFLQRTAR